jgi:hypothetical protein
VTRRRTGEPSRRLGRLVAALVALGLAGLACQPSAGASFDPRGPCVADGRAPGAFPHIEAVLPRNIEGRMPTTVDSGRTCSARGLSTYATHGITEVQYAGATWEEGASDGTVIAAFTTPAGQPELQQGWVEEFYETGARASTKTENIEISRSVRPDGQQVYRLDTLNDLSLQTVMVWSVGGPIRVVIVATQVQPGADRAAHEARVEAALAASRRPPA